MQGKRELFVRICTGAGITRLLESLPRKDVLLILNYHRIGNADETPYDSGTFSCKADEFDWQVGYLKSRYQMVSLSQVLESISGGGGISGPTVLITFDDGYIDNFLTVFPTLRRQQVPAAFFLPTAFVGTGRLPWWDMIAYIVKNSKKTHVRLEYPEPLSVDLDRDGRRRSIMRILRLYYRDTMTDHERFMEQLESACASPRPDAGAERCFLSWDEAREMQRGGMSFGSHTHTHEILSKLSPEKQREELGVSREIMEHELGMRIETLAYPVGLRHTFSEMTTEALRQTGYRAAFSFYGGFNRPGAMQPFDIRRWGVDGQDRDRFRFQTALGTVTGTRWW